MIVSLRGDDQQQSGMFSYVSLEERVPQDHPLRTIRKLVDEVLRAMAKEFDGLSLAPDVAPLESRGIVLRGIPKGMNDRISEVLLEISPAHQITRIVIHETDGATTDFRFSGMHENVPLQDSLFRFNPPPGIKVIQDDQVAQ